MADPDVVVIGSGPNGLSAAIELATSGARVLVLEARDTPGGGMRTEELTLPGFRHDACSAAHPLGALSPFLSILPLDAHGLTWIDPPASVAHPLDGAPAVLLRTELHETGASLGEDARAYERLIAPFLRDPKALLRDLLTPVGIPRHPLLMARFGLRALRSAMGLAKRFKNDRARALFAGCAAHSVIPLETPISAAIGLVFLICGHVRTWPVARGGSGAIATALVSLLEARGGRVETGVHVRSLADLPPARVYLFDTSPNQLASIASPILPTRYLRRLGRYRYGPASFKVDYALDGPIPWADARCLEASTVHLGGTIEEIAVSERAMWRGEHCDRPFVLVVQQSQFDDTRAPPGKHTGYAYCHVPAGSEVDMTMAIDSQIERFAPSFRDRILKRHVTGPAQLNARNPNYVGGAISGGVTDLGQLFTRPVARLNPYTTPHPRLLICSASTPPGGGVHGMCGYHAAQTAKKRLERFPVAALK